MPLKLREIKTAREARKLDRNEVLIEDTSNREIYFGRIQADRTDIYFTQNNGHSARPLWYNGRRQKDITIYSIESK